MIDKLTSRWLIVLLVLVGAIFAVTSNWPLNYGIDLRGGTTISYEIPDKVLREFQKTGQDLDAAVEQVIDVISTRIDTLGLRELKVRREGTSRIVLDAPDMTRGEREDIKRRMIQLGSLKFLIGIGTLQTNKAPTQTLDILGATPGTTDKFAFDELSANKQREAALDDPQSSYRNGTPYQLQRDGEAGEPLPIWWYPYRARAASEKLRAKDIDITETQAQDALDSARNGEEHDKAHITGAWLYHDPEFWGDKRLLGFTGQDIESPRKSRGNLGDRTVVYTVRGDRRGEFEDYTGKWVNQPMAIVLNDELWSAPVIRDALYDSVQITGGGGTGFTEEEQDWLVKCLQAGSLQIKPRYVGEENIAASLGTDAVTRGIQASIIGLILVVAFMLVYYRIGGLVAIVALVVNLFLIVALLALFRATITLPGIAGLILTIGISVDANILIFERIREEMAKGKTLVAAMGAGFDRAFVTIIDANLTTMLTAVALFHYGVGPIKGFAVTLMAGIACSLFAALYLSRTIFGTLLRVGIMKRFTMMRLVPPDTRYAFTAWWGRAIALSVILVAVSLGAFFAVGSDKYGLDFTGGVVVRANFVDPVNTSEAGNILQGVRDPTGAPMFSAVEPTGLADHADDSGRRFTQMDIKLQTQEELSPTLVTTIIRGHLQRAFGERIGTIGDAQSPEDGDWAIEVSLKNAVLYNDMVATLNGYQDDRGRSIFSAPDIKAINFEQDPATLEKRSAQWLVTISEGGFRGESVLPSIREAFGSRLNATEPFTKVNYVGPNVVANLKERAVVAIVVSLAGLLAYIWFRFKEFKYGLAAAVAVFHDVIIALGIVVLVNQIGLVHVPLNLPIIAGFLTILGYSLNDTIVLFDRIRENIGNIRGSYKEVINVSINQTLARTLLTSLTTFVVVAVLFALNYGQESAIEGISFTLMVGVVVGTYSSIFVASPVLVWLHGREEGKAADRGKGGGGKPGGKSGSTKAKKATT